MIRFKQFITEARAAPLYHGTPISSFKLIMTEGFQARTYHFNNVVGKEPMKIDDYGRLTVKNPHKGSISNMPRTHGISTTRRYKFAKQWIKEAHGGHGVVLELDQQKLTHRYKLIPVNFYSWGQKNARATGDYSMANEYEEFIVMKANEMLPWNMIKKIYVGADPGGKIKKWAEEKGIVIDYDSSL